MKRVFRQFLLVLALIALAALAVGPAQADRLKVAAIWTLPLQQKWVAVLHHALKAAENAGEIELQYSESVAHTDYPRVMREYAESGVDLIVGEIYGTEVEARKVAQDYPNIAFFVGSLGKPQAPNLSVFQNREQQIIFITGILAGYMTKTNKIGMVGGFPIPAINLSFHAFMEGARLANPKAEFKVSYINSWYDPPKAKEFALAQIDAGVDTLFAERTGVVDAARERGIIAFGSVNDMNKEENGTDVVVTSALWHMELPINHVIELVKAGKFKAEDYTEWTMFTKGGGSLAPFYEFEDRVPAEAKAKVAEMKSKILSGEFVVTENENQANSTF